MVQDELVEQWRMAGLVPGDTVLIHSRIKRLLMRYRADRISPDEILESFLKAVGPAGTVLFPLFNFDFTKGVPFDLRDTPSQMGALTEEARLHPNSIRTGHPIYSFAVIGRQTDKFKDIDNFSGYGKDSPFGILHQMNGKIAVLDLPDQHSMTFYHYIEEMHEVEYRYHKTFVGDYTDNSGCKEQKIYGLYVRNIENGILTHVNPTGDLMWDANLYSGDRPGKGSGFRVISASKMYDYVSEIILTGRAKGLLYRIEEEDDHGQE